MIAILGGLGAAISWGLSMVAGAMIALFAAMAVPSSPAAARRAGSERAARLDQASSAGLRAAGITGGGALLALVGSLFGALMGASRQSGVSLKNEFRLETLGFHGWHHDGKAAEHPSIITPSQEPPSRDETTILPPVH